MRLVLVILMIIASTENVKAEDFMGYPCTQDCSGHEAGAAWAERRGISDSSDCNGNSNSFIEGCRSYVADQTGSLEINSDLNENEHEDINEDLEE